MTTAAVATVEVTAEAAALIQAHAQDERVQVLITMLGRAEQQYQEQKDEWLAKLDKDPTYALEWSAVMFSQAATAKVHNRFLGFVQRVAETGEMDYDTMLGHIKTDLTKTVLNGAASTSQSTSTTANLMAKEELAANARLLQTLDRSRFL